MKAKAISLAMALIMAIGMTGCISINVPSKGSSNEDNTEVTESQNVEVNTGDNTEPEDEKETEDENGTEDESNIENETVDISDKLSSYEVSLDGKTIKLGITLAEFLDTTGYKVDEGDLAETIGESQYILISAENSNGGGVYLDIVNVKSEDMSAKDCIVGAISADLYQVYGYGDQEDEKIQVSLPGGVQIKKSTYEDVISKYGEPTETREGTYVDNTYLTWELDSNSFYDYVEIVIDNTTNTVYEFDYTKYY